MNTQTLRERFEKNNTYQERLIEFNESAGKYQEKRLWHEKRKIDPEIITRINLRWDGFQQGYQSSAEDNQCVVELPEPLGRAFTDYKCYVHNDIVAAIEASGARIKK